MQVYKCDVCGMIYDNYHNDQIGGIVQVTPAGSCKCIRKDVCPKCREWFENKLKNCEETKK